LDTNLMQEITNKDIEEYWDRRPCNINHSLSPFGTKKYFDEVEARKILVEPHILTFTDFPRWKGKKVLEIGCGIGTAGIIFARNGADYTGVELSEKSLEITKQRFKLYGYHGNFYLGNAEELSSFLPYQEFDLVYSFGVLHHMLRPGQAVKQIYRFMHKESILKIMLYAQNSWKNYLIQAGLEQPEAQSGCPVAKTYARGDIRNLLFDFEIIGMEQDHIFPYEVESYRKGIYKKVPWFEAMPPEIFKVLEKQLGWHMLVTAKLNKNDY
jgi:2-polyprenyl-3-methyl-5-hydroxy-6-metoxy-1,4-benzoquinol methylase